MSKKPLKPRVLPRLKLTMQHVDVTNPEWNPPRVRLLIAFTDGGGPCPFVIAKENKIAEQLSSLYLTKLDLVTSHGMLDLILKLFPESRESPENTIDLIQRSLWHTAIMGYGKQFSDSDDGRVKLDANMLYREHKEYLPLHKELMALRNKLVAHQTDHFEGTIPIIALDPDEGNKRIVEIYYDIRSGINFPDEKVRGFGEMITVTMSKVNNMICHREDKLLEELENMGMDFLYSRAAKYIT